MADGDRYHHVEGQQALRQGGFDQRFHAIEHHVAHLAGDVAFAVVFDVHHDFPFVESVGQTAPAAGERMGTRLAVVADGAAVRLAAQIGVRERFAADAAGPVCDPVHLPDAGIAERVRTASVDQAAADNTINIRREDRLDDLLENPLDVH